jgi:ribA/ribD-fused uncharacterized protein
MFTLNFYETTAPYGCFSNFSKHPVEMNGEVWATSEHFFQAAKFVDAAHIETIRQAKTAFAAARLGRERTYPLRSDWNSVRDAVMLAALRAKFTQNAAIGAVLASTSGAKLVEHTSNDSYWADGGDGRGANRLGVLLEQVRSELPPWPAQFVAAPWVEFPDRDPLDLFWRMGDGESHLIAVSDFYRTLEGEEKSHYDALFPVPEEWVVCRQGWVE